MKKIFILALLGLTLIAPCSAFYKKVPAGYVGVKVKLVGSERGVSDIKVVTGRVLYNAVTHEVHTFPTFMQSVAWTKNPAEGSKNDESISFETNGGLEIWVDVNLNLTFDPNKVHSIFGRYRKQPEAIIDGYLRQQIRNVFVEVASDYSIEQLILKKKVFIAEVNKQCKAKFEKQGFMIDYVGIIGKPRYPKEIEDGIKAKILATQKAQEAERQVQTAVAEAKKVTEKAKGDARAIRIKADALAYGNKVVARSLTPLLIRDKAIEKWNGTQPLVVGSDGLILDLGTLKK